MSSDLESSPMANTTEVNGALTAPNISGISYKSPFTKHSLPLPLFNLEKLIFVLYMFKVVFKIDLINLPELSPNVQACFKNHVHFR